MGHTIGKLAVPYLDSTADSTTVPEFCTTHTTLLTKTSRKQSFLHVGLGLQAESSPREPRENSYHYTVWTEQVQRDKVANAAQIFQRLIDPLLRGLDFELCYVYDTLTAFRKSEEHHLSSNWYSKNSTCMVLQWGKPNAS